MGQDDNKTINRAALFSSGAQDYVTPFFFMPGDEVTLRLRTAAGNVEKAVLVLAEDEGKETSFDMRLERTEGSFDYYSAAVRAPGKPCRYYFSVTAGEDSCCCLCGGFEVEPKPEFFFTLSPGYSAPEWALGAVMYQIFPDRFFNGDPGNDVKDGEYLYNGEYAVKSLPWDADVEPEDYYSFRGGDLRGIILKLPYLKRLGVETLYLNPIFTSPSSHKYDTTDYEHVDPHFGSDEDLAELTEKAHGLGIRVVLDGVFNHCGIENRSIVDRFGAKRFWWDVPTLPKLEYESSPGLEEYIFGVVQKWLRPPFSIDGWRLDVAADLGSTQEFNIAFWQRFHSTVRKENPGALVTAEHYGDPSAWLNSGAWDSVMNYDGFMDPLSLFLTGMEKHSYEYHPELCGDAGRFFYAMRCWQARLPYGAVLCAMDQLDNHDHSRFATRTNKTVGTLAEKGSRAAEEGLNYGLYAIAAVMQMSWPGAPCIYYGDEAGLCGWTDPDSRRTFPWDRMDRRLLDLYTCLSSLNHDPVFRCGSWIELYSAHEALAFGRMYGGRAAVTAVNSGTEEKVLSIELWRLGCQDGAAVYRVTEATASDYNVGRSASGPAGGILELTLKPCSAQILMVE